MFKKNMAPRRTQQMGAGPSTEQSYVYKVVLLGSTAVGKSSIAFRYVKNDFRESMPTVGCSFFTQLVCLETATIKLEIWDTAGQEKYHSVCHLYYRGANAALLVYDIARKATFARAKLWLRELEKEFLHDEIVIVLVGNKTDLAAEREVTFEEAEEFAKSKSLTYMETSAKSNHQVTEVFMAIAQKLLKQEQQKDPALQHQSWKKSRVDLREPSNQTKKCCMN
ncbi:ras-related protein Rab-17 [Dermochelys coriacea]|uniref:ras-related protein Rab-17 n=1 Tax=Dermochelys coriacea TaxID=27794 RepID=UPI0018E7E91A|nr:ras-related protein Rab-17 [Dermochelys coriacea]